MEPFLPMLQTLLGGVLAVVGGLLASLLLQSRSRRHEAHQLRITKLEQIHELSREVLAWTGDQVARWATMGVGNYEPSGPPDASSRLQQLKILAHLYHPILDGSVEGLEQAFNAFIGGVAAYGERFVTESATPDLFRDQVNDTAQAVQRAHIVLSDAIADCAKRYV